MTVTSAGLLLFRRTPDGFEVLLGHMGGPFWSRRDERAWSIPKGEYRSEEEAPLAAAEREFAEELGHPAPSGPTLDLGSVRSSRKVIAVFAREGEFDAAAATSNTFALEWPPRSGRMVEFPEIDRAAWFDPPTAARKLVTTQVPVLDRLAAQLG